jgi:HPt (histidine-containing phosphotransfer) domain-containing protein
MPHGEAAPLNSSSAPVVYDRVGMMERLMNDENLATVVTQSFLEDVPTRIEALRRNLELSNLTGVSRQAHAVKGAAANVGGEALRAVALEIEQAAQAGDLDSVAASVADLDRQLLRLKEAILETASAATVTKILTH